MPRIRMFRRRRGLPVGSGVVAARDIEKGAIVHSWAGARLLPHPTYQSVQVGPNRHVYDPACLNLLNHSCDPNLRVDVERRAVTALRDVARDELLTIFYPATEWEMARPFRCRCGAKRGLRVVRGARGLEDAAFAGRPMSRHIRALRRAALRNGSGGSAEKSRRAAPKGRTRSGSGLRRRRAGRTRGAARRARRR
jgi:hypothetical protein